jgi:hypothetical protein
MRVKEATPPSSKSALTLPFRPQLDRRLLQTSSLSSNSKFEPPFPTLSFFSGSILLLLLVFRAPTSTRPPASLFPIGSEPLMIAYREPKRQLYPTTAYKTYFYSTLYSRCYKECFAFARVRRQAPHAEKKWCVPRPSTSRNSTLVDLLHPCS